MEYAEEGNLESFVENKIEPLKKKNMYWKESIILNLFVRLLLGIEIIHESNFIHRDIKHKNILIFKDGQVKL